MKAKSVSLWVIVLAGVWVAALALLRAAFPAITGAELGLGVTEIIATGVFFVVIFTPVYRSIWLDKKLGAQVEEAKIGSVSTEELSSLLSAALEKTLETKNSEDRKEFIAGGYLHKLSDKDKLCDQESSAAGVAVGA